MDLPPIQYTTHTGDTKYIFSDMGKTNVLIDYFLSIVNVDVKNANWPSFYSLCDEKLGDIVINSRKWFFFFIHVSILPVNKAVGSDCISHKMLKTTAMTVSKPLCILLKYVLTWK